jgi:hypothetical protein
LFSIKADIRFKVVHMYAIISKDIHFVNRGFANTGMHPKIKNKLRLYFNNDKIKKQKLLRMGL